jgi:hypothetical protein
MKEYLIAYEGLAITASMPYDTSTTITLHIKQTWFFGLFYRMTKEEVFVPDWINYSIKTNHWNNLIANKKQIIRNGKTKIRNPKK